MSGTTSVPPVAFTDRGFVAPAESAIVTGLNAVYNAAFRGDLNTDPSTPAGQLIASTAAIIGDANDQEVALFNGVDPAYASGRMQDAIARIYFLDRDPAQSTVLQIVCGGASGVVIPTGASIKGDDGNIFLCTQAGIIGPGGTVTLAFASAVLAPIAVPVTVSIYQTIPQWDTATVSSGVVGNLAESRAAFELRREATVAANGAGFLPAISGAIAKVPGVIDYYVTENFTGSPVTIGGYSVAAHSLYAAVSGGAAADVALAIWTKKNPGCDYNGATTFDVYDTNAGYSSPYPGPYAVAWVTPTAVPFAFLVSIFNSPQVPSDAQTQIQGVVYAAFNGQDGGARARIGSTVFASRFYAGLALLGAWAQIVSIQLGTAIAATQTGSISGTTLTVGSGTGIVAGQFLFGTGVVPGTRVVSGATTTWVVSIGQTVSSTSIKFVVANQNDVTMQIDQIPTLLAGDVIVALI